MNGTSNISTKPNTGNDKNGFNAATAADANVH
jgi:hypothetical protein